MSEVSDTPVDTLVAWATRFRDLVAAHRDELTALDAAIGDADHGANLARGMDAAAAALSESAPATVGDWGKTIGMALVSRVGGASGPLYGTLFLRFGAAAAAASELDPAGLGDALRAGVDGVVARGKAEPGDKTMVDALRPAVEAWTGAASGGADAVACAETALVAAAAGRDATEPLVARKGRASYLGERSAGHIDPGAASAALLVRALRDALVAAS